MAASPSRVCWDACCWIALIQREAIRDRAGKIVENRYTMARSVIERAEKGAVEILCSGLCLPEVNKPSPSTTQDKIVAYFDNDYIVLVPVDRRVGVRARSLMFSGYPGLKPPDAIHLATALVTNAEELHTFDDRLLDFDGKLAKRDGTSLKICKPSMGGDPLPLFEQAAPSEQSEPVDLLEGDFYDTLILEGLAADEEAMRREGRQQRQVNETETQTDTASERSTPPVHRNRP